MPDEDALFPGYATTSPTPAEQPAQSHSAPDWQVDQIRRLLDSQGLVEMTARQELVEQLVGRTVASLRDLTSAEVRALAEALARTDSAARKGGRSTWDDRDGDTWIDRL